MIKQIGQLIFAVFLFLVLPTFTLAAPSVTGTSGVANEGQTMVVSGSGFGTKAVTTPVLWDTVDNQTSYSSLGNGAVIPVGGNNPWSENEGVNLSTSESRTGSRCYKSTNSISGELGGKKIGTSPTSIYISWWWKPSTNVNSEDHSSKFIRLSREADLTNQTFSWTQIQNYVYGYEYISEEWASYPGVVNQWNFHEVWFNNTNKTYTIRVNGVAVSNNISWTSGTFNLDYLWKIGWDGGGNYPPVITSWMDDIYVDNSFSRVMVCNNITYSSATKCEMQIPSAWSASSITMSVNKGSFTTGVIAYVYVVDSTGAVNPNGYPITIGSGSTVTPPDTTNQPAAPRGLAVL